MDGTVSFPRGGRVVFRSRFADYVGMWRRVARDVSERRDAIYPPAGLELMYRQNLSFVDSSPELGQVFPGFPLEVPRLA